jgi:hypothetical protein
MKSIKKSVVLILSSIFVVIGFSACSNDLDEIGQASSTNVPVPSSSSVPNVRVVESGYVRVQANSNALARGEGKDLKPEDITVTPVSEAQAKVFTTGEAGPNGSSVVSQYRWVTLLYSCKTADGTMKDLSELVVWPYYGFDGTPNQLVIGCHSTITSNAQRPTNFANMSSASEVNMLALFAHSLSQKALVIVPDYEGYGSTAGDPHPYCNRELTAEQVVTGAKAGLSYFESTVKKMDENWSGVSIGYSQGGAVSAGVLRYCQQHGETSLRLKGAVCGDGPYDPLATLKRYIEMDQLYMPVAPAMLLKGAVDTDPEMKGCSVQDFVTDKFFQTGIFDMIKNKEKNTDEIQAALLEYSRINGDGGGFTMKAKCSEGFLPYTQNNLVDGNGKKRNFELENGKGNNYCTVDQCLKAGVIEYFRNGTITGEVPEAKLKALEKSLAKNALTYGNYNPGRGFTFFHSTRDEVVPFCNLESVRNGWGSSDIKALSYNSGTYLHVGTGKMFFTWYCGGYVDEILKDKWAPCEDEVGGRFWTRDSSNN